MDLEKKSVLAYQSFSYQHDKDNVKNKAIYFFKKISYTLNWRILIMGKVCMFAPQNQDRDAPIVRNGAFIAQTD